MPRSPRKERSRALIRDAARAAFGEKPFAEVTMEAIALRAGLTRKTLYNLFDSKEDIVRAIVSASEAESGARYRARMAAGESALKLLEDAFVESARWCLANPTIAPIALAGPTGVPSMTPPEGRDSFQALSRDLVSLGQREGALRRDHDALMLSSLLLGAFANTMQYALSGAPFEVGWIAGIVRVIVEGIGARPDPTPSNGGRIPS